MEYLYPKLFVAFVFMVGIATGWLIGAIQGHAEGLKDGKVSGRVEGYRDGFRECREMQEAIEGLSDRAHN